MRNFNLLTLTKVEGKFPLQGRGLGRGGDYEPFKQKVAPSLEFVSSPQLANKFFSLPWRDRRVAFTLAEVLITLGVIGVVAAMTLPTVIKHYQQQVTVNKLKKVYTVLNQAFKMSEIDNDSYENWDSIDSIGRQSYIDKYWKPYLKIVKTCDYSCDYKSQNPYFTPQKSVYSNDPLNTHNLVTADGAFISVINNIVIIVDFNYIDPPNRFGHDVFRFNINNSKKEVLMPGWNGSYFDLFCSKTSQRNDNGAYCGGKIQYDGWKIKDDYPW